MNRQEMLVLAILFFIAVAIMGCFLLIAFEKVIVF